MNSWYQLLMLSMAGGQYLSLSKRLPTQYDWMAMWSLAQEAQGVNSLTDTETKGPGTLTSTSVP